MPRVTNLTSTWSSAIGPLAFGTPFQCRKGFVFISWAASAPSTIQEGLLMAPGDVIVVPAGNSVRLAVNDSSDHEVVYESFTA